MLLDPSQPKQRRGIQAIEVLGGLFPISKNFQTARFSSNGKLQCWDYVKNILSKFGV